jgi:hypothetical protein
MEMGNSCLKPSPTSAQFSSTTLLSLFDNPSPLLRYATLFLCQHYAGVNPIHTSVQMSEMSQ